MQRTESNLVFSEECGIQKDVDTERADAVRLGLRWATPAAGTPKAIPFPPHGNAEGNPVPTPTGTPKAIPTFAA